MEHCGDRVCIVKNNEVGGNNLTKINPSRRGEWLEEFLIIAGNRNYDSCWQKSHGWKSGERGGQADAIKKGTIKHLFFGS